MVTCDHLHEYIILLLKDLRSDCGSNISGTFELIVPSLRIVNMVCHVTKIMVGFVGVAAVTSRPGNKGKYKAKG